MNDDWTSIKAIVAERDALRAVNADLLAALKALLPWHDTLPHEETDSPVINQCRAAIARVEDGGPTSDPPGEVTDG